MIPPFLPPPGGADVLHAGRYAVYVDLAYGISAFVLVAAVVEALARSRRWRRRAERSGRGRAAR